MDYYYRFDFESNIRRFGMTQEEYLRIKKLFIFGIIVSIVTIFGGEIPIGWVINPESDNEILSMIMGYASLSLPQLARVAI